ncbi:hypothetical protein UT300003_32780 [Clostridium sardiniense]
MINSVSVVSLNNFTDTFSFPPRFGRKRFKCYSCGKEYELNIFQYGRRCANCGGRLIPTR